MPITTVPVLEPLEIHGPPHITIDTNFSAEEIEASIFVPPNNTEEPVFTLQQNTATLALRNLRSEQPHQILNDDYSLTCRQALSHSYRDLQEAIKVLRKLKVMKKLFGSFVFNTKEAKQLAEIFEGSCSSLELMRYQAPDYLVEMSSELTRVQDRLMALREMRIQFMENRRAYGPQQALYHQKIAMIRQKPATVTVLRAQEIIEAVCNWTNVWGVSVRASRDNQLVIRVGVCDLHMSESATETVYDDPQDILLAPFMFTIKLHEDGRFHVPSDECMGLSHYDRQIDYNFHPHQLSDTPCFGTFGQTLNDLASIGEVPALISTIIAFYSQYNSQDSAGVNARNYHPNIISVFRDADSYVENISTRIANASYNYFDSEKLDAATIRYMEYYNSESCMNAPCIEERHLCYNCEETPVDNDGGYFMDCNGERICNDCWHEYYCSDCENNADSCTCDPDDY